MATAIIMKYHNLGSLNNRNLLLHSSEERKPKSRVLAGLVLRPLLGFGLQMDVFIFIFPRLVSVSKFPLLIRTQVIMDLGAL